MPLTIKELRSMKLDELKKELYSERKKLYEMRIAKATQRMESPNMISRVRRSIARILFLIRESELARDAGKAGK